MSKLTEQDKAKIAKFERGLRTLYNSLKREGGSSDMTFEEFRKEFISLGDPSKMEADLETMKLQRKLGAGANLN